MRFLPTLFSCLNEKLNIKFFTFVLLITIVCLGNTAYGQVDQLTGQSIVDGATLEVVDAEINNANITTTNPYTRLELEAQSDTGPFVWFTYQIQLKITPYLSDGSLSSNAYTKTFSIEYNPNINGSNFSDLSVYNIIDSYGAIVEVLDIAYENMNTGTVTDTTPDNVTLHLEYFSDRYSELSTSPPSVGHSLSVAQNDPNPYLITILWNEVVGAKEYQLEWTWVDNYGETLGQPRDAADIDFSVRDFELNNTRVEINADAPLSYDIPLIYSQGYIIYRIRAVGRFEQDTTVPFYGPWSAGFQNEATVRDWLSYDTATYQILNTHENLKNWQFQSSYAEDGKKKEVVSYFDGSLRNRQTVTKINSDDNAIVGEVIYDNQGRPAIEVLPVPADNSILQYYDAFNINLETIKYSHLDFDWDDVGENACNISAGEMSEKVGASKYYSPNNKSYGNFQDYVPDAERFPFSQIEYTPDNTGRIRRKGGVGKYHQLGSDSEMKYYYSQPASSFELNRLFGYEVGLVKHYKKNAVVDPNGQVSVSYIDPQGRTIATALAGGNPQTEREENILEPLEDETNRDLHDDIFADLMESNEFYSTGRFPLLLDGSKVNKQIISTQNFSDYEFNYAFKGDIFNFNNDCPIDFPYKYDLKLSLIDDCGEEQLNDGPIIRESITDFSTQSPLTATLNTGEYTLIKDLIVNEDAIEEAWQLFLENANANCILTKEDFILINFDCSEVDCDIVEQGEAYYIASKLDIAYNEGVDYTFNISNDIGTLQVLDTALTDEINAFFAGLQESYPIVVEFCRSNTLCDINRQTLLADVSPQGQYGNIEFEVDTDGVSTGVIDDVLSIFNDQNSVFFGGDTTDNNWRTPLQPVQVSDIGNSYSRVDDGDINSLLFGYFESDEESPSLIEITNQNTASTLIEDAIWSPEIIETAVILESNGNYFVKPEELAHVSDFIAEWKSSWANALIEYHPEYCYLEYVEAVCNNDASNTVMNAFEFEEYLRTIATYQEASAASLIGSGFTQIMEADPFFNASTQFASEADDITIDYAELRRLIMTHALSKNFNGLGDDIPVLDTNSEVFGILSYSLAVVQFGSLLDVNDATSLGDQPSNLYSIINNDLSEDERNEVWIQYVNNYIGLRSRIYDFFISLHAIKGGCYNSCLDGAIIDQSVLDLAGGDYEVGGSNSFSSLISDYLNLEDTGNTSISQHISDILNNQQPASNDRLCPNNNYANKIKRFPGSTYLYNTELVNDEDDIEDEDPYYELTGKCKMQSDLEAFLRGFFQERTTQNSLTTDEEFSGPYLTIDLFQELGGSEGENLSIEGQILADDLVIAFNDLANPTCTDPIVLKLPTGLSWSNYGTSWVFKAEEGLTEIYYEEDTTLEQSGRYKFQILAKVITTVNNEEVETEYVLEGETCAKLNTCLEDCEDCDIPYSIAVKEELVLLLNEVLNLSFNSSTNIDLGSLVPSIPELYDFYFQPYGTPIYPAYRYNNGDFQFTFATTGSPDYSGGGSLIFKMNGDYTNASSFVDEFLDVRIEAVSTASSDPAHEIVLVYRNTSGIIVEDTGILEYTKHILLDVCLQQPEFYTQFTLRKQVSATSINESNKLHYKDITFSFKDKTFAKHELINMSFDLSIPQGLYNGDFTNGNYNQDPFLTSFNSVQLTVIINGTQYNLSDAEIDYNNYSGFGLLHCFDTSISGVRPVANDLSRTDFYATDFSISNLAYTIGNANGVTSDAFDFSEGSGNPISANGISMNVDLSSGTNAESWISSDDDADNTALSIFNTYDAFTFCQNNNPYWEEPLPLNIEFEDGVEFNFQSSIRLTSNVYFIDENYDPSLQPGAFYYYGHIAQFNNVPNGGSGDPVLDNDQLYSIIVSVGSEIKYIDGTPPECPCIVQTVRPQSCNDKWTVFNTFFNFQENTYPNYPDYQPGDEFGDDSEYTVLEATTGVIGYQLPDIFTEDYFCGMNYAYITEDYIHYLQQINTLFNANTPDHPLFMSIGEFGDTDLNYGFDDPDDAFAGMTGVIDAYLAAITLNSDNEPVLTINGASVTEAWWPAFVTKWIEINDPCLPVPMIPEVNIPITPPETSPCQQIIETLTEAYSQDSYLNYLEQLKQEFTEAYINGAIENANEAFTMTYPDKEYQYTLYYYDQAGNLIQTVPPQGVKRLGDGLSLQEKAELNAKINDDIINNTTVTALPKHRMLTQYRYNSLNQLVYQKTPDGGETRFAYDKLGRIVMSQNAKQVPTIDGSERYSYTDYDEIGRIQEAGELNLQINTYAINDQGRLALFSDLNTEVEEVNQEAFPGNISNDRVEVTVTTYDTPPAPQILSEFTDYDPTNNRNRVTSVAFYSKYPVSNVLDYDNCLFYSYDIHGNVKELLTDINNDHLKALEHNLKRVEYDYDLISGNVNQVTYQKGRRDLFIHRYNYDADNRITHVETSEDGVIWEKDANYEYYEHGPLARVLLGDKEVQGMDYVYTLQGWLKGVNAERLDPRLDIANDAVNNRVARDAFAYNLSYFFDDYKPRISDVTDPFQLSDEFYSREPGLKNGNIRGMTTALMKTELRPLDVSYNTYDYDQLNRIVSMFTVSGRERPSEESYASNYSYDRNGNLLTLVRTALNDEGSVKPMDELKYYYYDTDNDDGIPEDSNRLRIVKDEAPSNNFEVDIDFHDYDYKYDEIGQLLTDEDEGIKEIVWRVDGKVNQVIKTDGTVISFGYDGLGNRLSKSLVDESTRTNKHTFYLRDAQGNVLSVYDMEDNRDGNNSPSILDVDILLENGSITTPSPGELIQAQNTITVAGGLNIYTVEPSGHLELEAGHAITLKPGFTAKTDSYFTAIIKEAAPPTDLTLRLKEQHIYGSSRLGLQEPQKDLLANIQGRFVGGTTYVRDVGDKRYELTNHLGNVLEVITDKKLFYDGFSPDVVAYNDYYPFGMLVPNRHGSNDNYRYGFNGKEKDDGVKGEGVQYDYGFRVYDARLGKFLSVDPLFKDYAMLTPYQFASNTPIQAVDIDGKEGETYLEYEIKDGKEIVMHRVIEVDVYVAFSRNSENNHFYSKKPKKDQKLREKVSNDLASQYIDGDFTDGEGNPIVWRFNVSSFNVDDVSISDFRQRLRDENNYYVEGISDERTGIKAVIIQQDHLSDVPVYNQKEGTVEGVGDVDTRGEYDGVSLITINDSFKGVGGNKAKQHTLGHEIAHFFLRLHSNQDIKHMGDSAAKHDLAGEGILHYYGYKFQITKKSITSGDEDPYTIIAIPDGKQDLNQENVNAFLESIIDTGRKEKVNNDE